VDLGSHNDKEIPELLKTLRLSCDAENNNRLVSRYLTQGEAQDTSPQLQYRTRWWPRIRSHLRTPLVGWTCHRSAVPECSGESQGMQMLRVLVTSHR